MNKQLRIFTFIFTLIFFFSSTVGPTLAAITYTYDANGNMASNGTNCYEYNDANQVKKVTNCSGQTIAEYVYDYKGNRMVKKNYTGGTLQKTVFSPNDEFETVKLASNGATQNTSYYYANDQLVAKKDSSGNKIYYHSDHLGSTSVLTNQSGNLVENTTYDPWGEVKIGGTQSKFLYTGQEKDNETSLHYYNARYYDSHIRRFTQPDDIVENIYDPQMLNRYSYVRNNPIRYTDPTGHFLFAIPLAYWAIGAAVTAATVYFSATPQGQKTTKAAISTVANGAGQLLSKAASGATNLYNMAKSTVSTYTNKPAAPQAPSKQQTNTPQKGGSPNPILPNPFNDLSKAAISSTISYTYHATQRMDEFKVTEERVIEGLKYGTRFAANNAGESLYQLGSKFSSTGRGIKVVLDDVTNNIITVMDKGSKFNPQP